MKETMKEPIMLVAVVCAVLLLTPVVSAGLLTQTVHNIQKESQAETTQSQYWALLFAVGVYLNAPDQDRPSMLEACDDLYDTLLDSSQWSAAHIHTVKGSQATGQNLIKELLWLKQNVGPEDYVLVYITTHGGPLRNAQGLPLDLPPKDEADGTDEVLVMYAGFDTWYAVIWDDLLNFFLSIINCKGLCLIVDSCYSGGFRDPPFDAFGSQQGTAQEFTQGFVEDVASQGRIILMSTTEDTLSYGSIFSGYLIAGFQGAGDLFGNWDGINSAEETFAYADFWTQVATVGEQDPTISDLFPGEFPITYT